MRFLADENFNNHIFRALLLQNPRLDIVRVQDVGLSGQDDPAVLHLALVENRILLTHDVKTIPALAYERVQKGQPIPGILLTAQSASVGQIVEDLMLIISCSEQSEWDGKIIYLPLK